MRNALDAMSDIMETNRRLFESVSWIDKIPQYHFTADAMAKSGLNGLIMNPTHNLANSIMDKSAFHFAKMNGIQGWLDGIQKMPNTILNPSIKDTIDKIVLNQNRFLSPITGLNAFLESHNKMMQFGALNHLFTGATAKLSYAAAAMQDEENLDFVETVTQTANEIISDIAESRVVTEEYLTLIHQKLFSDINAVLSANKIQGKRDRWIAILSIFLTILFGILSIVISCNQNSQNVTIERFTGFKKGLFSIVKENTTGRTVLRKSNLRLNPKTRTQIVGAVDSGTVVSILDSHGEWVYISVLDTDDYPIHGWLLKKYLSKSVR